MHRACQVIESSEFIHFNIGGKTCNYETWQQVCGHPSRESAPQSKGDPSPHHQSRP